MPAPAVFRRSLLISAPALLVACASTGPIPLDRQAFAGVKRIAIPAIGTPSQLIVQVTNPYSKNFGILGRIASNAADDSRVNTLAKILSAQGFDPGTVLQAALKQRLIARGFTPAQQQSDASFDITITQYGFVASGDTSDQPFRPTVTLAVQLARTNDGTILLRDTVAIGGAEVRDGSRSGATFDTFVSMENDPARVAASLRQAFAAAADRVIESLS